jgi:hypothetical protein
MVLRNKEFAMPMNIQTEPCENKAYSVHIADVLNESIILRKVKAGWMAAVLKIQESVLSAMRRGTRSIPAGMVPDLDRLLGSHDLLEALAEMEGCGIFTKEPSSITVQELERIFILELREGGAANSEIAQAILDGVIDATERRNIHAKAVKMRRLWSEIEDRTAGISERVS